MEIAPAANTIVPQFDEIDGTFKIARPDPGFYCSLAGVDLYQRAGTNKGVKRMVLEPDVPENGVPQVDLLQQGDRDFAPAFEHARDQVGLLQAGCTPKSERSEHRLSRLFVYRPDQMCPREI